MRIRAFVLALLLVCLAAYANAQPRPEGLPPGPVVVTVGDAVVRKAPDRAWVSIAAETRARTPQEAQRANADAMSAVTAKLKSSGVPADAIQTTAFDLQPEFDYANGRQTLKGYVARNQVQVKVDALAKLGEIIAAAVETGATNVSGIRFDLQDRDASEREALRLAVASARRRADAAASGAGMRVDAVLRIEEEHETQMPPPRPMPMMSARAEAAPVVVPIEAGEIEVRARVTMTAAIR